MPHSLYDVAYLAPGTSHSHDAVAITRDTAGVRLVHLQAEILSRVGK